VTPTEFSISELQKYVGYSRKRVVQSYFGIDKNLLDPKYRESIKKTIDVLYISHFDGHKNHTPLLHAIAKIDPTLSVFLIGRDNGLLESLLLLKNKLGLTNTTITTKNKYDEELWNLYRSSRVFTFPSLYEGFGMPLIEALALGLPTTCSDIPVFREIGGDLVTYYDPQDPNDIARVIKNSLENGKPQPLNTVQEHVKPFTWDIIYEKFVRDLNTYAARSQKHLNL